MRRIIGLGYKARTGKDALGDFLKREYGFQHTFFAESLKEACRVIFGLTDAELYGKEKEAHNEFWQTTPRDILQRVGTEAMRQGFDNDVWVKSVEMRIRKNPDVSWVITDVRFPNEADAIKEWGGQVYRIDRPGFESRLAAEAKKHASETAMDSYGNWDGVILNDAKLPDLFTKAVKVIGL